MPGRFHMAYRKVQKNKVCAFCRYSNLPGSAASKLLIALEGEDRAERLWDLWLENWSFFSPKSEVVSGQKEKKQTNKQSIKKQKQNKKIKKFLTNCHI